MEGGPLGLGEPLCCARQLLAGLPSLDQTGIVHRDVKPANCRLMGGRLKLADFGLLATNDMGGSVYSSPVVADGVLYISTRDNLFAIGAK